MKKIYSIQVMRSVRDTAYIEAESENDAIEIAQTLIDNGSLAIEWPHEGFDAEEIDEANVVEESDPNEDAVRVAEQNKEAAELNG